MQRRQLPFVGLWREFGELGAGVVAGGYRGRHDGRRHGHGHGHAHGQRAQTVLAGTERATPPGDTGRRRAGRRVGRAGRAAKVPMEAPHGRRLHVQGVVDEDLGGPLGHRRRRVGEGVPGGRRRRAGDGTVTGAVVDGRRPGLDPGERRGQPRRDGWRTVGPGTQLMERERERDTHTHNDTMTHVHRMHKNTNANPQVSVLYFQENSTEK